MLIGVDGGKLGVYMLADALRIANRQGLDLVEIAPDADPPVCKTMDYGKYLYERQISEKAARKNAVKNEIKQMKFRTRIDKGDYETKKKHIVRFLEGGSKVKATIMFRGREQSHPELGLDILERLISDLEDVATVESKPKMEGRDMHMLLAPKKQRV